MGDTQPIRKKAIAREYRSRNTVAIVAFRRLARKIC